jgi:hypothetical protein
VQGKGSPLSVGREEEQEELSVGRLKLGVGVLKRCSSFSVPVLETGEEDEDQKVTETVRS